jgi:hypothetical protein
MSKKDTPNFGAWKLETLADCARQMYIRLQELNDANEQLRLDLKDAMKLVRQQHNKEAT